MGKHSWVEYTYEDICPYCKGKAAIHVHACGGIGIFHNSICPGIKQLEEKYPDTCQQNGNFGTHKSAWFWENEQRAIEKAQQKNQ